LDPTSRPRIKVVGTLGSASIPVEKYPDPIEKNADLLEEHPGLVEKDADLLRKSLAH
jgi:hypothetical protein